MLSGGSDIGCYLCDLPRVPLSILCQSHENEYNTVLKLELADSDRTVLDKNGNFYLENEEKVLVGVKYLKRTTNIDLYKRKMPKQTGGETTTTESVPATVESTEQAGGKKPRKLNEYFTKMLDAKKKNKKSFKYKGNTYKAQKTKTGMVVYKKVVKKSK